MSLPPGIKEELIDIGRRLDSKGFIAGGDGNFSVRFQTDRILITPSGLAKGRLASEDLVIVNPSGLQIAGSRQASSEYRMHLYVYQERPDVMACVHSHPPYATAFAVAGRQLPDDILPEIILAVGAIPLTEFAPPGTDDVPRSLAPYVKTANAFLLRNHGLLTVGRTLDEAYQRHQTVEHYAKIVHLAIQLGPVAGLPAAEVDRLTALRRGKESQRA